MATARQRFLRLVLIAAAALILYLPGLGRPPLWEPDEGRYAEIAREMYLSGDYVTPRDDFVRYFEKPPLVYWSETAAISIFGANEFAVRLPAALFSAAQVVVTAALAEVMFGEAVAILAAIALALSPLFFGFARFATLDPALAFFMTAALAAFYLSARARDFGDGDGRRWFVLSAAMLALGTLAKGPVAPMLCGSIALTWILVEGRAREIVRMPWISSIAVYGAIAIPWFALAAYRNPGFLQFFFIHEHFHRYLVEKEHGWGPWFFIPIVIGGVWPWIFFVPLGLRKPNFPAAVSPRSQLRFLMIWFAVIFLFFSIPRAKLGSYILPAIPALAIVAGAGMAKLWNSDTASSRRICALFASLNLLIAIAAAIAIFVARDRIPSELSSDALLIAGLLGATAIVSFTLNREGTRPGVFAIVLALGIILIAGTAARTRRHLDVIASYRNLAGQLSSNLHPGCILGSYRHNIHSIPFYTGFREALVSYRGELAPFGDGPDATASFIDNNQTLHTLWASDECFVLIANRKDLATLETLTPAPVIVGCEGKKIALSNARDAHRAVDCQPEHP
jgi:4-amino-4-deoxy-L-arabinose transferase-like glycosyltransferase